MDAKRVLRMIITHIIIIMFSELPGLLLKTE